MNNIRLFFPKSLSLNLTSKLDKPQSHYISKVMRIKPNEVFSLFNRSGEWEAKIREISNISIENMRSEKSIGSSLEAVIDLEVSTNYFKTLSNLNLSEIFICSKVEFKVSDDLENDEIKVLKICFNSRRLF